MFDLCDCLPVRIGSHFLFGLSRTFTDFFGIFICNARILVLLENALQPLSLPGRGFLMNKSRLVTSQDYKSKR